ncbi:MAG: peptidylprolyl isomerase [Cyclobacteriaceae bacterium]
MKGSCFVLVLCMSTIGLCQSVEKRETVLFSVASSPVDVSEFVQLYRKNNSNKPENFTEEKVLEYLDLYINFKLKVHEARVRGMDATQAFITELNSYKEELKRPYLADNNAVDRLTKEAYNRLTQEVKASHILINCTPDATPSDTATAYNRAIAIRERAIAGEDFSQLARENSDDPSARSNGGNLGYFTAFQMVYPFEAAAYETEIGNISAPVRTRFGYHIIKVDDKRPASGEVEVSHIFVRGNDPKVKDRILEVAGQLAAGRGWETVCSDFSEDPGSKNNGGRLRPFGVGALSSAPEFEKAAFSLNEPGQISEPVQTSYGWHILRLEKKIAVPPFDEMEASLRRRVSRDERLTISKQLALEKKKKEFGFREYPEGKDWLLSQVDTTLSQGKWKPSPAEQASTQKLIQLNGSDVYANEALVFFARNQAPSEQPAKAWANQLYEQFVNAKLDEAEDDLLRQKHPEYRDMLQEYREGILMFSIMEKEVWNKASDDTVGQRKFYDNNLERFKAGDRLKARIFSSSEQAALEQLKQKVEQGDTLSNMDLKKVRMLPLRKYEKGDHPVIDKIAWSVGWQEAEVSGMYYLVEVMSLVPPGIKTFDEARASVISDYQDFLEKQWVDSLRQRYPVKVNKKGKKVVLRELTKSISK